MLILRRPRTQQPAEPLALDPANPLVRGLEVVVTHGVAVRPGSISRLTVGAGSPTIAASVVGIGPRFTASGQRMSGGVLPRVAASEAWTLEVLCAITAAPDLAGFVAYKAAYGGESKALICFGGGQITYWDEGSNTFSGSTWRTDGRPQHVFATCLGVGNPVLFYRDGRLINTSAAITTSQTPFNDPVLNIGDVGAGWNSSPTGTIAKAAYYRRALSALEIAQLTAQPWAIAEAPLRRVWAGFGIALPAVLIDPTASSDAAAAAYVAAAASVESVSGSDIATRTAIMLAGSIEPAAGIEIASAGPTLAVSAVEAAAAADLRQAAAAVAAAAIEGASTQDALTAVAIASAAALESAGTFDLASALTTLATSISESASASDLASAVRIAVTAAVEAAVVSDLVGNGPQYNVTRTEGVATADALGSAATLLAQLTEAAGTVDQATRAAQLVALITEPAVAADSSQAALPVTYTVSITELVSALEQLSAALSSDVIVSMFWRFDVPASALRYDVPGAAGGYRFDIQGQQP